MKLKDLSSDKKTGKVLLEIGILLMVVNLLCVIGIWNSISNGWKVIGGGELFFQAFIQSGGKYAITYLNQESIYISFLSVLFAFLGNKEELVSIINLILQLAGMGFFYFGAKKLFGLVFSSVVAVISGILSCCFYPVTADNSMHIIWFLSGLAFWTISKVFGNLSGICRKHIILGIILGIFSYVDLAGFFFLAVCVFFTMYTKDFDIKEKKSQLGYFALCGIAGFFCMFCLWNNFLVHTSVFGYWLEDKMKYIRPENGLGQYIVLIVMLSVSCVFYFIQHSHKKDLISIKSDRVLQSIVQQEEQKTNVTEEIIMETKTDMQEIMTEDVKEDIQETMTEDVKADTQEAIIEETKTLDEKDSEQEVTQPIKFLENPLPLPKKRERKEMDYAFEPSPDQMHYDLNNYSLDDDYDLKD